VAAVGDAAAKAAFELRVTNRATAIASARTTLEAAAANAASVGTVKGLVAGATYTMTQADATNEAAVKTAIENIIAGLALDGVTTTVTRVLYTPAEAGTQGTPAGINGTYTFTVDLSKGADATLATDTTATLTMTITATAYVPSASAALDLTPVTGTRLAGVVLTDDNTGNIGDVEANAIELSVAISPGDAATAVFVPVTENATVTAYANNGTPGGAYAPVAANYDFSGADTLWIKVVSEDGNTIRYYNVYVYTY
jgi:hypothetical protein